MAAFALPLVGAGISALTGLFGNKKPQQSTIDQTQSVTPNLDPQQQFLQNLIGNTAANQVKNGPGDLSAYEAGGLQNINQAANLKSKTAANILASRGLSFSPSGVQNLINPEADRLNQSSQFLSQIPLLQRQFQQQDLGQLMNAFGIMPKGSTSITKGTTTGTPANPTAGLLSGAGQGIFAALPYLKGMFGGGGGSGVNTVNAANAGVPFD
jgi:hypothetical protein